MTEGRAWVLGDNIDTDVLAPGYALKLPPEELAQHCLEAVEPAFAKEVKAGDILVAGENFGMGSSREQAAISLKLLGISVILARSFARIFYRNAINIGLPAMFLPAEVEIGDADRLRVETSSGEVANLTTGEVFRVLPIPPHLLEIISAGGLMPHLKTQLETERNDGNA